jgi:hypothetical protein
MEKRLFSHEDKRIALERQEYMCGGGCGTSLWREPMGKGEGHHIVPFSMGGSTQIENLIVLCHKCHTYHDNQAICGNFYGGYQMSDMDESQIRDQELFERSAPKIEKNRVNPDIIRTLIKQEKTLSGTLFKYGTRGNTTQDNRSQVQG